MKEIKEKINEALPSPSGTFPRFIFFKDAFGFFVSKDRIASLLLINRIEIKLLKASQSVH